MSKTINTIVAIALVSLFPALTIYAGLNAPTVEFSEGQAIIIATDYLKVSPTFSFDGIEDTIELAEVDTIRMPNTWSVTLKFDSRHAGYGNRTGEMVAQVITEHTAKVVVSSGEVRSAVIDDTWDEFNQREKISSEILPPEEALNIVIEYLQENYDETETLDVDIEWSIANLTPENLVGASTIEYSGNGWTITIHYPVVWKPNYSFEVEHTSGFTWSGTVDQSGSVTETE